MKQASAMRKLHRPSVHSPFGHSMPDATVSQPVKDPQSPNIVHEEHAESPYVHWFHSYPILYSITQLTVPATIK
jgi:hypothetical protein